MASGCRPHQATVGAWCGARLRTQGGGPVPGRAGAEMPSWGVCMAVASGCSFCFPSEPWGCRLNCLFPVRPACCAGEVGGDFYSILGTTEPGEAGSLMDSPSSWSVPGKAATLLKSKSGSTFGEGDFRSFRELLGWVKSTHSQSGEASGLAWHQDPQPHLSLDDPLCHWLTMCPGNITVPPALPLNTGRLSWHRVREWSLLCGFEQIVAPLVPSIFLIDLSLPDRYFYWFLFLAPPPRLYHERLE